MFIRLENIYSSELGKFWEMADDTTKQISAYRLASRNIVHTAFLAFSMNSIIHVALRKHIENVNPARKQNATLSLKKLRWRGVQRGLKSPLFHFSAPPLGVLWNLSVATESNNFASAEATGAAGKIMPAFQINHDYHGKTPRLLGDRGASLTSPSPSPDIPPASSRCTS